MIIYPAIDLYDGKAVRLFKGDYAQMTVYSDYPPEIAEAFIRAGARRIHTVDLEGAKEGSTPNFDNVLAIKQAADAAADKADGSRAFVEIGEGI
jgi:phosphoribosylformimino-5-aminoimidazole carboxamide ribotide isomerase